MKRIVAALALVGTWAALLLVGPGETVAPFLDSGQSTHNTFLSGFWVTPTPGPVAPPECAGLGPWDAAHTFIGTDGNDYHLEGTSASDLIFGLGGNDQIDGGDGNDCLVGGPGNDHIEGGHGDDVLVGEGDNDKLEGGPGHDWLYGGDGNDDLRGDDDADHLYGGNGNDDLRGGDGNDALDGGPNTDRCSGDSGANTIVNCEPAAGPHGLAGYFHHSTPTITLTWAAVDGTAYYNIYRSTVPGGGPESLYDPMGSSATLSFDDFAVTEGATYYYVVIAVDIDGFQSKPSNEAAVNAVLAAPTPTPTAAHAATATSTPAHVTATPTATASPTPSPTPTKTPSTGH
jgi:hypothetical protein